MLEPELEKQRVLEERRAQRQARIQQYMSQTSPSESQPPPPQQQHTSTFNAQIQGGRSGRQEVLVIDPRNRGEEE
jgi:hypothetical protein